MDEFVEAEAATATDIRWLKLALPLVLAGDASVASASYAGLL